MLVGNGILSAKKIIISDPEIVFPEESNALELSISKVEALRKLLNIRSKSVAHSSTIEYRFKKPKKSFHSKLLEIGVMHRKY